MAKERFEKAREITREHRAAMDRLSSKKVTPAAAAAAAANKPVSRRSPRNNVENNPPSSTFVPSNLVVGEFNFGGVSKQKGANGQVPYSTSKVWLKFTRLFV